MEKWKVTKRDIIFESPWFNFLADRCIMQDGSEMPGYYWIDYRPAVIVLGTTNDGKVVMVEQYRHGVKEVLLEFPAGLIDEGEESIESAKRELLEETGYAVGEIEFQRTLYPASAYCSQKLDIFFAKGLTKVSEQKLEATEHIDVKLIDFDKMIELVENGELKGAVGVAAILMAEKKKDWFLK